MKKVISLVLFIVAVAFATTVSFAETQNDWDYNGANHHYADKAAEVIYNDVITDTTRIDFTGKPGVGSIQKTTSSPNDVDAKIEIANDATLNQNVLSITTSNPTGSGNSITEFKTGLLGNHKSNDDESVGNSTAIHLDINYGTNQVSWFQFFGRNGGKISGSNTNLLGAKAMHMRWISGVGTYLYFGNADGANADNWEDGTANFKVWKDFQLNTWYNLVIVFNDNGTQAQDSIQYFVDGKLMFEKVGLNTDFNQSVTDLSITQQASNTAESKISFANLFATRLNLANSIEAEDLTLTAGEEVEYDVEVVGENPTHKATFSQYEVSVADTDVLVYNEATQKFLAQNVEAVSTTDVTFTLISNPTITKTVTVTVEPTVEDILPNSIDRINLLGDLKLVVGERLNLNGLFDVSPVTTTNKNLLYTVSDASSNVLAVEANELVGVAAGTKQLVVTSVADPSLSVNVNVVVQEAIFSGLNDFELTTSYPEANPTVFINGWASRASNGKTYGVIDMSLDPVFGVVPTIHGAGGSNAGASTLFNRILFEDNPQYEEGKDYILRGYIYVEGASLGQHRGEVKILVLKEGNTALSSSAPFQAAFQLPNNPGNADGWRYFETAPINADVLAGAVGFQIEAISWNHNADANVSFANFAFIEQETVAMVSSEFVYNDAPAVDMSANLNDELQFGIKYVPSTATSDVLYTSSDESVATIDANGLVKVVGYGTVEISSTVNTVTKTVILTVLNPVETIAVDKSTLDVTIGQNATVNVTINPSDHTDKIEVLVGDSNVVSYTFVDNVLTITAKAIGTSTVTVKVQGKEIQAVVNVTVLDMPVTNIIVKEGTAEVSAITGTVDGITNLTATVQPITRVDKTVTYVSVDPTVATVDANGLVTFLKEGTTVIKVTSGAFTKDINVTVSAKEVPATSINVDVTELTLNVEETGQINVSLVPSGASGTLTYTSSDQSVVTVDQTGKVTAIAKGTAQIIITSGTLSKTVDVTVNAPASGANLTQILLIVGGALVGISAAAAGTIVFIRKRK